MPTWRDKLNDIFGPNGSPPPKNGDPDPSGSGSSLPAQGDDYADFVDDDALSEFSDGDVPVREPVGAPDSRPVDARAPNAGALDAGLLDGGGEPVLVIDDDGDWCHECAFSLEVMGFRPHIAQSAEEAVALLMRHEIGIAIVDYNMPEVDGISLIHELASRAEERGHALHFIMATGYATKDVAIDAMRASVADFLEKPITEADLRRALQRVATLRPKSAPRGVLLEKITGLTADLQRLAALMDTPGQGAANGKPGQKTGAEPDPAMLKAFIRDQLKRENKRREIGGGELFGDPTWSMLLDLLLAKIDGRLVPVSSACIASGAPMSTALRLVRRLVDEDVLCRIPDESDRRRHFLVINPKFEGPLVTYLIEQLQNREK